jgi:hypothetical protein
MNGTGFSISAYFPYFEKEKKKKNETRSSGKN